MWELQPYQEAYIENLCNEQAERLKLHHRIREGHLMTPPKAWLKRSEKVATNFFDIEVAMFDQAVAASPGYAPKKKQLLIRIIEAFEAEK